jgi:hypothetical protein
MGSLTVRALCQLLTSLSLMVLFTVGRLIDHNFSVVYLQILIRGSCCSMGLQSSRLPGLTKRRLLTRFCGPKDRTNHVLQSQPDYSTGDDSVPRRLYAKQANSPRDL